MVISEKLLRNKKWADAQSFFVSSFALPETTVLEHVAA
jgi:hypothetical protein